MRRGDALLSAETWSGGCNRMNVNDNDMVMVVVVELAEGVDGDHLCERVFVGRERATAMSYLATSLNVLSCSCPSATVRGDVCSLEKARRAQYTA